MTITAAQYEAAGIRETDTRLLAQFWASLFPESSVSPWIRVAAAREAARLLRRWRWPAEPLSAVRRDEVKDLLLPLDRTPVVTPDDVAFTNPGYAAICLFVAPEAWIQQ